MMCRFVGSKMAVRHLKLALISVVSTAANVQAGNPCKCLEWKEVYASGRAVCGEGAEFYMIDGLTNYPLEWTMEVSNIYGQKLYNALCSSFFTKLPATHCVNMNIYSLGAQGREAATWCYVSSECKKLNGGAVVADKVTPPPAPKWLTQFFYKPQLVPRNISWKTCEVGADQSLRMMDPGDFLQLADSMRAVKSFASKFAYPVFDKIEYGWPKSKITEKKYLWSSIQKFVRAGELGKMPKWLQDILTKNVTMVVHTQPDGFGRQIILRGRNVWELVPAVTMEDYVRCHSTGFCHKRLPDVVM